MHTLLPNRPVWLCCRWLCAGGQGAGLLSEEKSRPRKGLLTRVTKGVYSLWKKIKDIFRKEKENNNQSTGKRKAGGQEDKKSIRKIKRER